jgi:HD-like signal output (HDOD) protein
VCEREVFGCTHAEVGAYLLGLWGLPDAIVEAVAWHHEPSKAHQTDFSPLIAVHAADHCDHLMHSYTNQNDVPNLDEKLLIELGLKDRMTAWMQACQELDRKGEEHA